MRNRTGETPSKCVDCGLLKINFLKRLFLERNHFKCDLRGLFFAQNCTLKKQVCTQLRIQGGFLIDRKPPPPALIVLVTSQ